MKRLVFFLMVLILATLACSSAQIGQSLASSGGILYQDDFSNAKSGWGRLENEAGLADYKDGAYRIYVKAPNVNLWAHAGLDFSTIRVEANAMAVAGPQEDRMGLICRRVDDANFYYFVISADGYYGIGKVKGGAWSLLNADQMQHTDAIKPGNQANHLRADCIGNLLILYVNDLLVGSAKDADFAEGDVGLIAGTFDVPGVDVYFDNFMAIKP